MGSELGLGWGVGLWGFVTVENGEAGKADDEYDFDVNGDCGTAEAEYRA